MKQQITSSIQELFKERYLSTLLVVFILICIGVTAYLSLSIHSTELQVVVHYTSFGVTNFYRDRWYYLISFIGSVFLMAIGHSLISYRILKIKGPELAAMFVWLSIVMVIVAGALFYQILKIASLS